MKTRGETALKLKLCNAGYSEKAVVRILNWYTFSKKSSRGSGA